MSEENVLKKLTWAKKRVSWKKKSVTCCSACIATLSTLMFLCACYRITIWPPPYHMQVASRANADSLADIGNVDGGSYWVPHHKSHGHDSDG